MKTHWSARCLLCVVLIAPAVKVPAQASLHLTPAETEQHQAAKLRVLAEDWVKGGDDKAYEELMKYGPRVAGPVLIEELKKEMMKQIAEKRDESAAWTQVGLVDEMVKLIKLAPETMSLLEEGLRDKRPEIRVSMLLATEELGPLAKPAIPAIGALLKDEWPGIRWHGLSRVMASRRRSS